MSLHDGDPPVLPLTAGSEERGMREAVAGIARSFGPDYFQRQVDEGGTSGDLWRALGSRGYLGVHLPEEHGGGGLGLQELALVAEETAAAGAPLLPILFSPGIAGTILDRSATPEQQRRWIPGIASGDLRVSFAITEPDAGTNSHRIATVARRDGDGYVLDGQKHYITGVESADLLAVVARTGTDAASGRALLSVLLVDADAPGLSRSPIRTMMNVPEGSWQLFFDGVHVPADRLIGEEGGGLAVAFTGMNTERILTSSICTGLGRYALGKAARYASERAVWGKPIGTHQAVAHPLAQARIHLDAAELMTRKACRLYDAGHDVGASANMAKYLGSRAGLEALDSAIQVHGGNGVAVEYGLATYFFVARMLTMGPVANEMILNFVAERQLGLPRSY